MSDSSYNPEINLYFIKSKFEFIIQKLCRSILKKNQKILINLGSIDEKKIIDKYLWVSEQESFIPHKVEKEKIHNLDKIILFDGNYKKMSNFLEFQQLIISPNVSIKKFEIFRKFFVFSYFKSMNEHLNLKNKLKKLGFKAKCFIEYNTLKWKVI